MILGVGVPVHCNWLCRRIFPDGSNLPCPCSQHVILVFKRFRRWLFVDIWPCLVPVTLLIIITGFLCCYSSFPVTRIICLRHHQLALSYQVEGKLCCHTSLAINIKRPSSQRLGVFHKKSCSSPFAFSGVHFPGSTTLKQACRITKSVFQHMV